MSVKWMSKKKVRSSGPRARLASAALPLVGAVIAALPTAGAAQEPGPVADVRARELAFARTMADRDFEAFLTFVSEEAVFFDGDTPLRGRAAIGRAWRTYYEGRDAPFSWEPDLVEVLASGDLALSTGPVRNVAGEASGRFQSIWRLEADDEWRVVFDRGCP